MKCLKLLVWFCVAVSALSAGARDVFVVLSGGVSPFNNNYSQYLQAKALNEYFERHYGRNSVWTFFGAGNVAGEKLVLCDVKREVKRNGLTLDSWLAGPIPHNLSANRDVVLRTFRDEILPAVANGGTLYLFVGDHGSRPNRSGESEIDLWAMKRDPGSANGWRYETNAALGVAEFRRALMTGIGKGKVVFCMTQCHSGGFHTLGMPTEMTANKQWFKSGLFTRVPGWVKEQSKANFTEGFPAAAGFCATDEFSLASGCDPDPDPDKWAGYERFIPENLLGLDLFTLKSTQPALKSFQEAHVAATLQDFTIDKPASTSDEFLARWATLIDTKLVRETKVTSKVQAALTQYRSTLDGTVPKISDAAFRDRQEQFTKFVTRMGEQNPDVKNLVRTGSRRELESAIGRTSRPSSTPTPTKQAPTKQTPTKQTPGKQTTVVQNSSTNSPMRRPRGGGANSESRKLWKDTVSPVWAKLVTSGEATNLVTLPIDFERHLLKLEKDKDRYFLGGGRLLEEEGYWFAGHGKPETLDHARAEDISRWTQERRNKILAWAEVCEDEDVQKAAKKIGTRPTRSSGETPSTDNKSGEKTDTHKTLDKKTAAERALYYRRVLGAWQFLIAVNERPALERLQELITLERTPLPQPRVQASNR